MSAPDVTARHCGQCNYNIHGLAGHVCPECGADLLKVGIRKPGDARRHPFALWLVVWSAICFILWAALLDPLASQHGLLDRKIKLARSLKIQMFYPGIPTTRPTWPTDLYIDITAQDQVWAAQSMQTPLARDIRVRLGNPGSPRLKLDLAAQKATLLTGTGALLRENLPADTALTDLYTATYPTQPINKELSEIFNYAWTQVLIETDPKANTSRPVGRLYGMRPQPVLAQRFSAGAGHTVQPSALNTYATLGTAALLWTAGAPLLWWLHRKWVNRPRIVRLEPPLLRL